MRNSNHSAHRRLAAYCVVFWLLLFVKVALGAAHPPLQAAHPTQAGATSLRDHFVAGQRLTYKMSYRGNGQTDFSVLFQSQRAEGLQSGPAGLAQSIRTSAQGRLVITVVEIRRDALVLAYNLPDASVTLFTNDNEDTADAQAIRNDLRRDVFAVVDRQGKVLSLRFDAATSQISRNFARTLIAATQFVFLPQQRACLNQWETQEEDANGQRCRTLPVLE